MMQILNLGKYYPTRYGRRWVFRGCTLTIPRGCNVGVIGRNGAGKSTFIRLLGGIETPSEGEVRIEGSVSWPMGLHSGWQGSMTGRENAKFIARIYGLDAEETRRVCAFAAEFSELGEYFDMPVSTYSAGMRSRLAFAVSMAFEFDWYLFDEIAAVGDAAFYKKSAAALQARRSRSNWIMVGHDLQAMQDEADAILWFDRGRVLWFDDPVQGVDAYRNSFA